MRYASPTLALLPVAGWEATRPYLRKGTWRPTGTKDVDVAAQIIRLSDLVCGVDHALYDGTMPEAAVARYRAGKIKRMPDSSPVAIRTQSSGDSGSVPATAVTIGDTAAAL